MIAACPDHRLAELPPDVCRCIGRRLELAVMHLKAAQAAAQEAVALMDRDSGDPSDGCEITRLRQVSTTLRLASNEELLAAWSAFSTTPNPRPGTLRG